MAWIHRVDPAFVERRLGANTVTVALSTPRVYAAPPALDASGRLVADVVETPGGRRLTAPLRVSVRLHGDAEMLDVTCACRRGRICDHVGFLLVDVAFHPALREALASSGPVDERVAELPRIRARALEERTIDERLACWLPARQFDETPELDVQATTVASSALGEGIAALLVRHRRSGSRALLAARDVLASRLPPSRRRLLDLTAPYHLDRKALVATRGQASILIHLLREEIGTHANGFRQRVRFGAAPVAPRVEVVVGEPGEAAGGDRLVPRWYAKDGAAIGDAGGTFLFAGPFPYLWAPDTATFHPVDPAVDLDAAAGMHRVPSLPIDAGTAARIGRALLVRGPGLGVGLPPPADFGLPALERPSFELRLTGSPLDVTGELFAVYAAASLPVGAPPLDGRDIEAEEAAQAQVLAAGFTSDEDGRLIACEERAVLVWSEGLAALRAAIAPRFEVVVAAALATVRVLPPVRLDVRVTAEIGWLETELEVRAGAVKVEIDRLQEALATNKRWVVLSDGSIARIASEVRALLNEASALTLLERTSGRLPPHQFGRIARWIELADGETASVTIDARAADLRARLKELAARPEARLPSGLGATLRPYQESGLAWLQLLRELGAGGLLADDMGLGKTLMTLAFLARWKEDEPDAGPSLVVCPTSVVGGWVREAERFTAGLRVRAWTGPEREAPLEAHDLVVTTYGRLRRHAVLLAKCRFRCVVLDEAQNVKNPAAETSRAARRLDATMRIALTGTPIENRLSELWSILTFVNPGILGTARDFDERYERPIGMRPDGEVAAELRAVVRPFILRRTKQAVLPDLPPKTEIDRACVFGLPQKRLYDALAITLRRVVGQSDERRKGARTHVSVLTAILRLRQMACDPRLVEPGAPAAHSAKRAAFLDLVRELVSENRRALVFSQFVELLTLWREDLDRANVAYEYLDGATRDRDAVVARWQAGDAPLFLISLKAGGAGLNLTAADTVIHCDPWWNPAAEDQATDRAHRIGQTRPVTVVRLVAQGTIEDKIGLLKRTKRDLADAIVRAHGASGALRGAMSDEDIALLLGDADGEAEEDDA